VTDKSLRAPADLNNDAGPVLRLNDDIAGDLAIGAINGVANPANTVTLIPRKLDYQQVYNLWIDVTNGPFSSGLGDGDNAGDTFSIWIQRLGETSRLLIASNYNTDRDLLPDFLTATGVDLNQLTIGNGNLGGTIYFDDIYISKSGYNSTVPVSWTTPAPSALAVPVLTADVSTTPGTFTFTWDAGALMSAPTLLGPWSVVPDSFGLFYSLPVNPELPQMFIRLQR
jgi:hypothetical protein